MRIITREELYNENPQEPQGELSPLLVDTINELLKCGYASGDKETRIESTQEQVMKELFEKRELVEQMLKDGGYTVYTTLDELAGKNPDIGWDLPPRQNEHIPEEILASNNIGVPSRGGFSYKNYRLWVSWV